MARKKPKSDIAVDDPRYVKALAHPLRIRILAMLGERAASPVQLAQKLDATLGAIAYHVRTLHQLDLIELVETRQRRGATEHVYRAVPGVKFADEAWGGLGPVGKQRMVGAALRQIGEFANGSAAAGGFDREDAQLQQRTLTLDEKGFAQLAAATKKWLAEADRIQEAAGKRLAKAAEPEPVQTGVVVMAFEGVSLSDQAPEPQGSRVRRRPGGRTTNNAKPSTRARA
jgi:DNA-binding transcriptional ArsR family regulator